MCVCVCVFFFVNGAGLLMLTQSEISKLPCLYVVKAYIIHSGMFLNLVQIFKLVRNICLAFEVKFQYMKSIVEYKMS